MLQLLTPLVPFMHASTACFFHMFLFVFEDAQGVRSPLQICLDDIVLLGLSAIFVRGVSPERIWS